MIILRVWKNGKLIYKNCISYLFERGDKSIEICEINNNKVWLKASEYTALEISNKQSITGRF